MTEYSVEEVRAQAGRIHAAGPYKIVITKPQPASRGFDSGEDAE